MSDAVVETEGGFVANYPPFGVWSDANVDVALAALDRPPAPNVPLGLYVHVPFCRKRCKFCYFKVYTETPSAEIRAYVDGVTAEAKVMASKACVGGRSLDYVYVGGGTPSFLSSDQIRELFGAIRGAFDVKPSAEITFECEPGTVREPKIQALKELGVTRVSLGVESWDERVLEINGRAHEAKHIEPAYALCRELGIPQVNIDLVAGLVAETEETWAYAIEKTIALAPDSVTIYQMEIPRNSAVWRALHGQGDLGGTIVDIPTRRRWAREAFEALMAAGYSMTSGYTAVRGDPKDRFIYRDRLWHGADMIPLGVSSFGQVSGVHMQNDKSLQSYLATIGRGELALQRAYAMSDDERLIRELILQLKLGEVALSYFQDKFGVDLRVRFGPVLADLARRDMLHVDGDRIVLTWDGLLRVDHWLSDFFLPEHGGRLGPGGALGERPTL